MSNTRTGWTIGSGVEAALGGNWTGKIEYLYVDLGNQNGLTPVTGSVLGSDVRAQVFRVGLNYRIGGTGIYAPEPRLPTGAASTSAATAVAALPSTAATRIVTGVWLCKVQPQPGWLLRRRSGRLQLAGGYWVYGLEADIQDRACKTTAFAS